MRRWHREAGLEVEAQEQFAVGGPACAGRKLAHAVIELVKAVDRRALEVQQQRDQRPEGLVQPEPEAPVPVEPGKAMAQSDPAGRLGIVALDPLGRVDDRAADGLAPGVGVDPDHGGIVRLLDLLHELQQFIDVGRGGATDLDVAGGDALEPKRRFDDHAQQPDPADDGAEEFITALDGAQRAIGAQHLHADDLMGKAAVVPALFAVDVGADGAGDAGVRLGRAGRQEQQLVMDQLVDLDQARAGLDGDLCLLLIEVEDAVHLAHVEDGVAAVEGEVAVAPSAAAGADGHVPPAAVVDGLAALVQRGGAGHKRPGAQRSDQRADLAPLHEIRECLGGVGHMPPRCSVTVSPPGETCSQVGFTVGTGETG